MCPQGLNGKIAIQEFDVKLLAAVVSGSHFEFLID